MRSEIELFHRNYQKLGQLMARSRQVFEKLNIREESLSLKPPESFRILVVGRNRSKKIALINSLTHKGIPNAADLSACTAGITIRWDKRERAVVHFANEFSSSIEEEDLIQRSENQEEQNCRLQIEVPPPGLHKYIPLNRMLEGIDIFIEDSFYMDGIEVIDIYEPEGIYPGKELKELAQKLNIKLVLFSFSAEELKEIIEGDHVKSFRNDFNSIFYIIYNTDDINNEIRNSMVREIKGYTRFGEEGIFFMQPSPGEGGEEISGASINDIRNAIHQEHRREGLYKPLYELTRIVKETTLKIIPELYTTAEGNAQDVEMIYNRTTAAVKRAQLHRDNICDRIVFFKERIKNSIGEEIEGFLRGLPQYLRNQAGKIEIKPSKNPGVEIYKKIEEQLEIRMYEWIINTITPLIDAQIREIVNEEEYSLRSFCFEIDSISKDYGRARGIKQPAQKYVSAFEKFPGLLKTSGKDELSQYIKSINENLVAKIIFSRQLSVISRDCIEKIGTYPHEDISKCRDEVLNLLLESIGENSKGAGLQMSEEIFNQIEAFFEYVKVKIGFEIDRVQSKVEQLKEYKNKLQRATDIITECERELKEIDNELIELVFETMGA